jgi:hypothetical protein
MQIRQRRWNKAHGQGEGKESFKDSNSSPYGVSAWVSFLSDLWWDEYQKLG